MCGETDPGTAADSTLDEVFGALSSADRRFVLRYLDGNGATTRSTLGDHLAAERYDTVPASVTHLQRREAAIRLHHVHIPKLAAANLVDPAEGDDLVVPTPHLSHLLDALPVDLSSHNWIALAESAGLD